MSDELTQDPDGVTEPAAPVDLSAPDRSEPDPSEPVELDQAAGFDEPVEAEELAEPVEDGERMELDDLPAPPDSGDAAVDEATAALAAAMSDPLEVQLAAYELAHRTLQDRLADVEN